MTASFYFQANTLQTKQKVNDYNTSLICIYHILICEASISNITPSDHEVCDGKHTSTTNQIFVTRVKSMQHTITHSKQDKNIEFYINLCEKNSHLQPKKLPCLQTIAGAIFVWGGFLCNIYHKEANLPPSSKPVTQWHSHNKQGLSPFIETIAQNYHKVWMECDLFWICSS